MQTPGIITKVSKQGADITFTRSDGVTAVFHLGTGACHVSSSKTLCYEKVNFNKFKSFFAYMSIRNTYKAFSEYLPEYASIFAHVATKEKRCSNVGTIIERFYKNYKLVEKWHLMGLSISDTRFDPNNFTKAGIAILKDLKQMHITNHIASLFTKNGSYKDLGSRLCGAIKYELINEPSERQNAYKAVLDWYSFSKLKTLIITYNYDCRRLIRYVFEYLPNREGFTSYGEILRTLADYAHMHSIMARGHSWEKYPRFLKSKHDIAVANYNLNKVEYDEQLYSSVITPFLHLEWRSTKDIHYQPWSVTIPKNTEAIKNEGASLHHCVGSYVDRVLNNELIIMFLRNDENIPRVTLEVRINPHHCVCIDSGDKELEVHGYILQAQGINGSNLEECEVEAISEFCKHTKLKLKRN